jgi:hypothetical protein
MSFAWHHQAGKTIAEPITAMVPVAQDKRGKGPQGRRSGDWKHGRGI